MNSRYAYRIAYTALVGVLLFACAPRPADTIDTEAGLPVAPVAADGPAPTDAVQPMSAPTAPAATPIAPTTATTPSAPPGLTPDEAVIGRAVYARACVMCHGVNGAGIPGGPPKVAGLTDLTAIRRVTAAGSANMPPMQGLLAPGEIDAVSKFVAAGLPAQ